MTDQSPKVPEVFSDVFFEKLLSKIGSEFEPEWVTVQAEDYATPLNCFANVGEKVSRDGGKAHYGWSLHRTKLLYEAERHAVWENEDEELLDVTPNESDFKAILFISDNTGTHTEKLVDNVRVNRTKNPLVDDFIVLAETVSRALAYGEQLGGNELAIPEAALFIAQTYGKMKDDLLAFIRIGGQPHSACYCGTYKSCHGSQLREGITMVMDKLRDRLGSPG